ncbi:unnamed protein product [Candida verbasci]|uniref:Mannosyltransferase n=1 Tax=Candida verbasci TaxID=1227364 RepID=A0A9W4XBF6_9ASCO|nr:unnamed protein product [Candida verbasci]
MKKIINRICLIICLITISISLFIIRSQSYTEKRIPDLTDEKITSKIDSVFYENCQKIDVSRKANATIVMLCRNSEIDKVIQSMKSLEGHFNQWFNYPWTFLNDEPFSENFKQQVSKHTNAKIEFGLIPKEQWDFPNYLSKEELDENFQYQSDRTILYSNLESYHKMCRYYSGAFFKHPLISKYKWYWRVEPNVKFHCDLTYDPFIEMEEKNKKYGFNIILSELYYTTPNLFRQVRKYIQIKKIQVKDTWKLLTFNSKWTTSDTKYLDKPEKDEILREIQDQIYIKKFLELKEKPKETEMIDQIIRRSKEMPYLHEDRINLQDFNLCHFWSNFEIARVDLFSDNEYQDFFNFLDESGGFYKERWGDAPIHSLYVGMKLNLNELHYFRDIGYQHDIFSHCPRDSVVGCNCNCPNWPEPEIELSKCMSYWVKYTSDDYKDKPVIDVEYWENKLTKKIEKHLREGGKYGQNLI